MWYFVSKFTNFDAKKLYRLYKYGLKKGDEKESKNDGKNTQERSGRNSHSANSSDQHHNNHKERTESGSNNHNKQNRRERDRDKERNRDRERDRDRRDNKRERERDTGPSKQSPGVKRKLEEGECDPEPVENKRLAYITLNALNVVYNFLTLQN